MADAPKPPKERRRYIAGAKCPSCGALDKIYVIGQGGAASQHCNSCGFTLGISESPDKGDSQWHAVHIIGSVDTSGSEPE
ncbi:MAG: YheV family putative metal-binding protein [Pseudomonadales bacterium]|jgi:uncharacterized metal-binding protein (TIGR02443 family)